MPAQSASVASGIRPGRFRLLAPPRDAALPPAWPPRTTLNPICRNPAWSVRLPVPIIPRVNASTVSLRWIRVYTWTHFQNFGWTNGQTIAVSITALPIITLEAVTAQVEHKGIAEFRFTRTGSTDEDLTFNLEFSETGETTTTKFRSGKSTLTLYHWAVDTDSSDEPLCTITWLVIAGEGYVRGDPFDAVVDIEGPGTTCT